MTPVNRKLARRLGGHALRWIIVTAVTALVVTAITHEVEEQERQEAELVRNDCKPFEIVPPQNVQATGFDSDGRMSVETIRVPGRTSYHCADGVTRHREG